MVGLVGPDGAGKTTAIRLMVGALEPTSGLIRVAGYELPAQVEKAREDLGYLAQRFSLYGDLTVRENLDFFGEVFDVPNAERKQRSEELLRFAGLEEFANRPAAALSGGMQKKLGLATALVHRPKVLLLDEPTGGVDPVARQEFWHLLIGLLRAGSAVLVSTPYMDEAMRFNRVIFMNHGRALTQGAPRDLMNGLAGRILELATEQSMAARKIASEDPDVEDVHTFGEYLHLRVRCRRGPAGSACPNAWQPRVSLLPILSPYPLPWRMSSSNFWRWKKKTMANETPSLEVLGLTKCFGQFHRG